MTFVQGAWRYISTIGLSDYIDMLIVGYCLYRLLRFVGNTKTEQLLKGVAAFLLVLWLSSTLHLNSLYFALSHLMEIGVLALVVLFQPEIRRLLERLGSGKLHSFLSLTRSGQRSELENAIAQTVLACSEMAKSRTGVLIVFERENSTDRIGRSGTVLDARVSSELLKNIFFVKAAMHDGAVIIRNGRIYAAGCVLPLSNNVNLSRDLGMRHRAGIGMSEASDAVVVIVSEETGTISAAIGGQLKRHLMPETLEKLLSNELLPQEKEADEEKNLRFPKKLFTKKGGAEDEK